MIKNGEIKDDIILFFQDIEVYVCAVLGIVYHVCQGLWPS
jgi:hypothetical protein